MEVNLSIQKNLPKIALLHEGAKLFVQSGNYFTQGVAAGISLRFLNVDTNHYLNQQFSIAWNGITLLFTLVDSPDLSGLQLTRHFLEDSEITFLEKLADELNHNFLFSKDLQAHHNPLGAYLYISARQPGTLYQPIFNNIDLADVSLYATTAGTEDAFLENYKVLVVPKLFTEIEKDAIPLGMEAISPNNEGVSQFDIAQYFAELLSTGIQWPNPSFNIYDHPNGCLKYFINYTDFRGGAYQLLRSTFNNPSYIINGGLSKLDRSFYNDENREYFLYGNNSGRFLTWCPQTKFTTKKSPERLYFLNQEHDDINLWIDATESNGNSYSLKLSGLKGAVHYQILEFVVDYNKLSIPSYKDVVSYEIYLSDGSSEISERRKYILDETNYENTRHLVFKNSLGVFETLFAPGDFSKDVKHSRSEIDSIELDEFTSHKSTVKNFGTTEKQVFSGNTGFVTKDYLDYLRDFLLSEEVYLVYSTVLIPVNITSTKAEMFEDRKHLYALSFSFEYAYEDHKFSREVLEEDFLYIMLLDQYVIINDNEDRIRF